MRKALGTTLFAVALLAAATAGRAATDGRIAGEVRDGSGKPLADVQVTISALEVTFEKQVRTNKKGKFALVLIDASRDYMIRLEKEGYGTREEPLNPTIGGTLRKEWILTEGAAGGAQDQAGEELLASAEARGKALKAWERGRDAYTARDLDGAQAGFEEALSIEPEMAAAFAGLARVALDRKDWEVALGHGQRLMELKPEEILGLRMVHDAYVGLDRTAEAEAMLEDLIEKDRTSGTAARVFNSGVSSIRSQDYEKALMRLEEAVAIDATLKEAYVPMGQIYRSQGDAQKALDAANKFLELQPGSGSGLVLSYQANVDLGNDEAAAQILGELKASSPAFLADTFMKSGTEDFNANRTQAAIDSFEKVLEAVPDHPRAHFMLGLAYAGSDAEKAKGLLAKFVELAPDDPEVETAKAMIAGL